MSTVANHYTNQIATSNGSTNSYNNDYNISHKRRVETEAEADERRRQNAIRMRQTRMNETYEAGVERRMENANRMRRAREGEPPEIAAERRRKNAMRMRERRLSKSSSIVFQICKLFHLQLVYIFAVFLCRKNASRNKRRSLLK